MPDGPAACSTPLDFDRITLKADYPPTVLLDAARLRRKMKAAQALDDHRPTKLSPGQLITLDRANRKEQPLTLPQIRMLMDPITDALMCLPEDPDGTAQRTAETYLRAAYAYRLRGDALLRVWEQAAIRAL